MTGPNDGAAEPRRFDVVVIGGGNAGLVAALTARHLGASVLLLDRAPRELRGGNTRHTRNIRLAHGPGVEGITLAYPPDELYGDLCSVGTGPSDEALAHLTVERSEEVSSFMRAHGVRWQPAIAGTLQLERTNRFFLGGGKALVNTYHRAASTLGITVAYEATVEDLVAHGDRVEALVASIEGRRGEIRAGAVVVASGGWEADLASLEETWGPQAANFVIRGAADNDGIVLRVLERLGAASAGEERGFHAVAVDRRAPRFDGGIATRIDAIPFGIVVDAAARRFSDEGADLWPKRYASWGSLLAVQPDALGYVIWDQKVDQSFLPPMYPPQRADAIGELASALGLDPAALSATVAEFNAAVVPGTFNPGALDGCSTSGLSPDKTNWAQRIDTPPFRGIALAPGITFTYRGVRVDERAYVRRVDGSGFANLFAAGEVMSGNVLSSGYLAGFGLTIGHVWGRIAGRAAAEVVGG